MGWFKRSFLGEDIELPTTSGAQQNLLEDTVMPALQKALGVDYQDLLSTDLTGGTQSALLELERLLSSESPSREVFGDATSRLSEILGRGPTDIDDFIQSAVIAPSERYVYEEALPMARSAGAGMGSRFGGGQDIGEQEIISDYLRDIDAIRAETALEGRYKDADIALRAADLAAGMAGRESEFLTGAAATLDMPRQIDLDAILAALDQEFRLMQLGGQIGTTGTVQTQVDPGDARIFLSNIAQSSGQELGTAMGSAAKGAGGGGGMLGGMM
jgi:hypothetical protein